MLNDISHLTGNATAIAATLFIHSTIIVSMGLLCSGLIGKRVAHVSLVFRLCVLAVILTPLSVAMFHAYGVFTYHLPAAGENVSRTVARSIHECGGLHLNVTHEGRTIAPPVEYVTLIRDSGIKSSATDRFRTGEITPRFVTSMTDFVGTPRPSHRDHVSHSADVTAAGSHSVSDFIPLMNLLVTVIWVMLSLFTFIKIAWGCWWIKNLRRSALPADDTVVALTTDAAKSMNVPPPPVLRSSRAVNPFLAGVLRPVIILPAGSSPDARVSREVIIHELAHLKNRDTLWNMLCQTAKILLPFQPLLCILGKRMKINSDFICDDFVLNMLNSRKRYASQLYHIARDNHTTAMHATGCAGFFSVDTSFRTRIERILDRTRQFNLSVHNRDRIITVMFAMCAFASTGLVGVGAGNSAAILSNAARRVMKPVAVKRGASTGTLSAGLSGRYPAFPGNEVKTRPVIDIPSQVYELIENTDRKPAYFALRDNENNTWDADPSTGIFGGYEPDAQMSSAYAMSIMNDAERERIFDVRRETPDNAPVSKPMYDYQDNILEVFSLSVTGHAVAMHNGLSKYSATPSSNEVAEKSYSSLEIVLPESIDYAGITDPERVKLTELYKSLKRDRLYPTWSPNGEWIAFNDTDYGVWIVNVETGEPFLVFDNYYRIEYNRYSLHYGDLKTLGFSPDGMEIVFRRYDVDSEWGTMVTINEVANPFNYEILNPMPVIESVDIATGESRVLAKGAVTGSWSSCERFFAYITVNAEGRRGLQVWDTKMDRRYEIACSDPVTVRFSTDNKGLVISEWKNDREARIRYIPVDSDTEETTLAKNALLYDISPDGEWLLISDALDTSEQYLLNMDSGETRDAFPSVFPATMNGRFSPDGSRICFNFRELRGEELVWNICLFKLDMFEEYAADPATTRPETFSLYGNFPNPFNMATTIEFSLGESNQTSLAIYNSMGQKVRELVSGWMTQGSHRVVWDGRNDRGEKVSTGVYVSKLTVGKRMDTHKMLVVK